MPRRLALAVLCLALLPVGGAQANPQRQAILGGLAGEARMQDKAFKGFSAERGRAFYQASHGGGKAETPSCTTCHTADPRQPGQTKAGKEIKPMAVSKAPMRFSDPAEVDKWFGRNCNQVLGRECTATEKGDILTYLIGQ